MFTNPALSQEDWAACPSAAWSLMARGSATPPGDRRGSCDARWANACANAAALQGLTWWGSQAVRSQRGMLVRDCMCRCH